MPKFYFKSKHKIIDCSLEMHFARKTQNYSGNVNAGLKWFSITDQPWQIAHVKGVLNPPFRLFSFELNKK